MRLLSVDYHYIGDEDKYLHGIYPVSAERLENQIKKLGDFFTFIGLEELLTALTGKEVLPENSCLMTLDDGLKCQYDLALPLFDKYKIPAIFFVNALPYTENKVCFVHQLQLLRSVIDPDEFYRIIEASLTDNFHKDIDFMLNEYGLANVDKYRYDDIKANKLKFLLNSVLSKVDKALIVGEIFKRHFPDQSVVVKELYMSAGQLKELGERGYLGLHSYDHSSLSHLGGKELTEDIRVSKKVIEDLTGITIESISYPYGGKLDVDSKVIDVCRESGFKLGFTFERAFNRSLSEPLLLARADANDVPGGKQPLFEILNQEIIIKGDFKNKREVFFKE